MLRKIYRALDKTRSAMIIVLLGGIILLCVAQIILRYFTSASLKPFAWGDEIIRLTSIWVVFLAASVGVKTGAHLSVEFFINKYLPARLLKVVHKAAYVIVLIVLGALVWFGGIHVGTTMSSSLQNLDISMAWFYAAIPVGAGFLMLEYLILLIWDDNPFIDKTASASAGKEEEA